MEFRRMLFRSNPPSVSVAKMFPTASPHCPIAGESRTDCARRRMSCTLKFRHSGWCTPLYREAYALTGGVSLVLGGSDGSVTNSLTPIFLPHHQLPNTHLFTPSPTP